MLTSSSVSIVESEYQAVLDDGEQPGGSAEAGAEATRVLDDDGRAPPGSYYVRGLET